MPKEISCISSKLKEGKFVTLAELETNASTSINSILDRARNLQNSFDGMIVSREPETSLYLNTLVSSYFVRKESKLEPIYAVDSRDSNRLGLLSDILTASQLGINNILVSTGTHTTSSGYTKAKPVFDLDEVQLISLIKEMAKGRKFLGEDIAKPINIDVGALMGFDNSRPEMEEALIRKKKEAGVSYLVTLPVYESEKAKAIANLTSSAGIPLIVTLRPIDSTETAAWINKVYPSSKPPEDFIGKIKGIQQSSTKGETRTKEITEANRDLISMLVKELRVLKGISGCNIVSTKIDVTKPST